MKTTGVVTGIISNLVTIQYEGHVAENEICYIDLNGVKLMAEVIKVSGKNAFAQVYESTRGLHQGDKVEFDGQVFHVYVDYKSNKQGSGFTMFRIVSQQDLAGAADNHV